MRDYMTNYVGIVTQSQDGLDIKNNIIQPLIIWLCAFSIPIDGVMWSPMSVILLIERSQNSAIQSEL